MENIKLKFDWKLQIEMENFKLELELKTLNQNWKLLIGSLKKHLSDLDVCEPADGWNWNLKL